MTNGKRNKGERKTKKSEKQLWMKTGSKLNYN